MTVGEGLKVTARFSYKSTRLWKNPIDRISLSPSLSMSTTIAPS